MTLRVYGAWAGNPKGHPEDTSRCIESVMDGFHSHQCIRKRGNGPDGLYCKQHDPQAVKARDTQRQREWDAKQARQNQKWHDQAVGSWIRQNEPERYVKIKQACNS
jgi:hypothetical protein